MTEFSVKISVGFVYNLTTDAEPGYYKQVWTQDATQLWKL